MKPVFCFFNSMRTWGGGEKWHFETASQFIKKGHKVIFFAAPGSALAERVKTLNCDLHLVKTTQFSALNRLKVNRIKSVFLQEGVTHLLINSSEDVKLAGLAGHQAKVPHIVYRRGSAVPIKNSLTNRLLFGKVVTRIIANSEATKNTILANNPNLFPKNKIKVIYNGIDTRDRGVLEPVYKKKQHEIVLGNAGRLSHEKGQKGLLEMAVRLREKGLSFKLLIAGSGKLEHELKEYIQEHDLHEHVLMLGFVEEIHRFMQSIDIFLMSSKWEGFGYVTAEALLNKKPVVAFAVGSNPEIVSHQKSGYVVPEGNAIAFQESVETLMRDKHLRDAFGVYGKTEVRKKFREQQQLDAIEQYLIGL